MDAENVVNGGIRHRVTHVREQLEHMDITRPDAPKGFVTRLAEENGWTIERAEAADREYRRFLLLAWTTTAMVVPSKDVDAAWHEHLLHTRHYWDTTCRDILGKTFHHDPGDGSEADASIHAEGYARTLALYEEMFGGPAPQDVWPRPCGYARQDEAPASREAVLALQGWTVTLAIALVAWIALPGVLGAVTACIMAVMTVIVAIVGHQARLAEERTRERERERRGRTYASYAGIDMRKPAVGSGSSRYGSTRSSRSDDRSRSSSDDGAMMAGLWASDASPASATTTHAASRYDTPSHSSTSHSSHSDTGSSHSSHSSHSCGGSSSHSCGGSSSSSCGGSSCGGGGGCGGS